MSNIYLKSFAKSLTPLGRGSWTKSSYVGLGGGRSMSTAHVSQRPNDGMTAWQVHSFGQTDSLKLNASLAKPKITRPSDVIVKVKAASLNPLDIYMIEGYGSVMLNLLKQINSCEGRAPPQFPLTVGRDFSGELVSKGNDVRSDLFIGDQVYGCVPPHVPGCFSEYVVVSDSLVCRKPANLTHESASSIMYTGLTAWGALKVTGDLFLDSSRGKKVLVLGGTGGVGTIAVQLLKAWGTEVYATSRPDAFLLLESLNVDAIIDYTKPDAMRAIQKCGPYDIILDASGHAVPEEYVPFLKSWANAKFITLRSPVLLNTDRHGLIEGMARNASDFIMSNISSGAPHKGSTVRWGFFMPLSNGVDEISRLVEQQKIIPVIDSVYKYEDLIKALDRLKLGHTRGKVVITMDPNAVREAKPEFLETYSKQRSEIPRPKPETPSNNEQLALRV